MMHMPDAHIEAHKSVVCVWPVSEPPQQIMVIHWQGICFMSFQIHLVSR